MNKLIYSYFNGSSQVKADPQMIELKFRRACRSRDFGKILADYVGPEWFGDPEKAAAEGITEAAVQMASDRHDDAVVDLSAIICEAFGVKTIEQDADAGLNLWDIINLWDDFLKFQTDIKKNTETNASSPPPGEACPPSAATKDSSDTDGIST